MASIINKNLVLFLLKHGILWPTVTLCFPRLSGNKQVAKDSTANQTQNLYFHELAPYQLGHGVIY